MNVVDPRARPLRLLCTPLLLLLLLLPLLLNLAGCGSQEGETVMTGGPETTTNVGKAPRNGTYLLFTAMSPNPTATVKLNEGDPLGFRKLEDGRIEAVAGTQTFTLGKGTAQCYWKVRK